MEGSMLMSAIKMEVWLIAYLLRSCRIPPIDQGIVVLRVFVGPYRHIQRDLTKIAIFQLVETARFNHSDRKQRILRQSIRQCQACRPTTHDDIIKALISWDTERRSDKQLAIQIIGPQWRTSDGCKAK